MERKAIKKTPYFRLSALFNYTKNKRLPFLIMKMKRPRLHEPIPVACSDPENLTRRADQKKKEVKQCKLMCKACREKK